MLKALTLRIMYHFTAVFDMLVFRSYVCETRTTPFTDQSVRIFWMLSSDVFLQPPSFSIGSLTYRTHECLLLLFVCLFIKSVRVGLASCYFSYLFFFHSAQQAKQRFFPKYFFFLVRAPWGAHAGCVNTLHGEISRSSVFLSNN